MFITLIAVFCLANADPHAEPNECVPEVVTDQYLAPDMSLGACLGVDGLVSAMRYMADNPRYSNDEWHLGGWGCKIGNKAEPKGKDT